MSEGEENTPTEIWVFLDVVASFNVKPWEEQARICDTQHSKHSAEYRTPLQGRQLLSIEQVVDECRRDRLRELQHDSKAEWQQIQRDKLRGLCDKTARLPHEPVSAGLFRHRPHINVPQLAQAVAYESDADASRHRRLPESNVTSCMVGNNFYDCRHQIHADGAAQHETNCFLHGALGRGVPRRRLFSETLLGLWV